MYTGVSNHFKTCYYLKENVSDHATGEISVIKKNELANGIWHK